MKYFSTRDKNLNLDFKEIFLRGLAPDGGLFLPKVVKRYSTSELVNLKKLNYQDLAYEIISNFCGDDLKPKLTNIIKKSYSNFFDKNVVTLKQLDHLNFLELYHGPTLAFKDYAMQVIGNIYEEYLSNSDQKITIVVATSGDTGAAAIYALANKKNINLFVLHPENKVSPVQRKFMTTVNAKNIFNLAIKGNFDDCQSMVKKMFMDEKFRKAVNLSAVNSINWGRIICQIVYYFYAFLRMDEDKISFAVPTGNFGDIYAGYMAKKMGLPIDKLIIATNENDILHRVATTGKYEPKGVKPSISPSMDIQVSSNFERLIFDLVGEDAEVVAKLMQDLSNNGSFTINKDQLDKLKKDFLSCRVEEKETLSIIDKVKKDYNFIIDPHTATATKYSLDNIKSKVIVLCTAHPFKFKDTIENKLGIKINTPPQAKNLMDKAENFDTLDLSLQQIIKYILDKTQ